MAHNGNAPRGVAHRWVSVCEMWGRDDGHLEGTEREKVRNMLKTTVTINVGLV